MIISDDSLDQQNESYSIYFWISGLHWVWCIGRGPHVQLRQEPQGTSDFRFRSQGPCRLGTGESGLVLGTSHAEPKLASSLIGFFVSSINQ